MELEEALKKISELESKVETLTKENSDYKSGSEILESQIKDKEVEIQKMKDEAKDRGIQFKKLRDMTAEEKDLLSEKEKELLQRQEMLEEEHLKVKEMQSNFEKSQRESMIENLAMKKAGGNREIADKLKISLSKIKDIETKNTEAEIIPELDFVFNGLGISKSVDPLTQANNQSGSFAEYNKNNDYSETEEGKALAGMLNLSQAQPDNNK